MESAQQPERGELAAGLWAGAVDGGEAEYTVCQSCLGRTWRCLSHCHVCGLALRYHDRQACDRAEVIAVSRAAPCPQDAIVVDQDCIFFDEDGRHARFRYKGVPFSAQVSHRFAYGCILRNIAASDPATGEWFSTVEGSKIIRIDPSQETSIWVYLASKGRW